MISQSDNITSEHKDSKLANLLPVHSHTISKLKLYPIKNIYIICKVRQFLNAIYDCYFLSEDMAKYGTNETEITLKVVAGRENGGKGGLGTR